MRSRLTGVGCLFVMLLTGCATGFQSLNSTGTYESKEISPGKYKLYYLRNSVTDPETAQWYWHHGASKLCKGTYSFNILHIKDYSEDNSGIVLTTFRPVPAELTQVYGIVKCKDKG